MRRRTKAVLLLILFVFVAAFFIRFFAVKPEKRIALRGGVEKVTVKATTVKKGDINITLSYVGGIKAKDEINVYSKVTGKLAEYTAAEGDRIEKGQVIALIDRDETGLKYELAKVESPISGILGRTLLDKGATVLPSAGFISGVPVAVAVNMDEMIVRLNIAERDISYIKNGLKAQARVDAYPDEDFPGEISKVSEIVDPQTRTLPVEITIQNKDYRLKSGMFCRIKILAGKKTDCLTLPQDAVIREENVDYAFVVYDHTARKKRVALGTQEDSRIEVLGGLTEAERVIVFGQQGLKDGMAVEEIEE